MEIILASVLVWLFFGGLGVLALRRMILNAGNKIIKRDYFFFALIFILGFIGLIMSVFAIAEITTNNERGW